MIDAFASADRRLGWNALTPVASALITLSALGSVGAWLGSTARLPFVAGIDNFLPRSFARVHPRWRTPHVSLWGQAAVILVCILLSQAGTTVKGAYDILVSMTVISLLLPFLLLFAAAIRVQREPAGPEVIRVPGGRPAAIVVASVGLLTTAVAIVLSVFPPADTPRPGTAIAKVVGLTILNVGAGVVIYGVGRRRRSAGRTSS